MNTEAKIRKQLDENPIILYMKGTPTQPQCGFSGKTVALLNETNIQYAYVNVLEAPFIREKLPSISQWPTYPQLFVKGELIGGCDIVEAMSKNGSLVPLLTQAESQTSEHTTVTVADLEHWIKTALPEAQINVTGEGCSLVITVISERFTDLSALKRQQLVLASLTAPLATGELHAVSINAHTPIEWQNTLAGQSTGLLQISLN